MFVVVGAQPAVDARFEGTGGLTLVISHHRCASRVESIRSQRQQLGSDVEILDGG